MDVLRFSHEPFLKYFFFCFLKLTMLIEGIGKYKIFEYQPSQSVIDMKAIPLEAPLIQEDYLVCEGGFIALCHSHVIIFRTKQIDLAVPKIFTFRRKRLNFNSKSLQNSCKHGELSVENNNFVYKNEQNNEHEYLNTNCQQERQNFTRIIDLKNKEIFPYEIESFNSIYHCTNIIVDKQTLLLEFDMSQFSKEYILKELESIKGKLLLIDGIYTSEYFADSPEKQSQFLDTDYIVKCSDANLNIPFEVLKIDSTNEEFRSKIEIFKKNQKTKNIKKVKHKLSNYLQFTNSKNIEYTNESDKSWEASVVPLTIKSVLIEKLNNPGYSKLLHSYLKNCVVSKYNFIKHAVLQSTETFYFTILKINDTVTVLISRKLFNFSVLFNIINSDGDRIISTILNIPDLNSDDFSDSLDLSFSSNKSVIIKYQIPECVYSDFLDLPNKCLKIQIVQNTIPPYSFENCPFWFIKSFQEAIYPLKFPGLISCPLLDEMEYLLQGPYPSIFFSAKNFKNYHQVNVQFRDQNDIKGNVKQLTDSNRNPWIKYIKDLLNGIDSPNGILEFLNLPKCTADDNYFASKKLYLALLLGTQINSSVILPSSHIYGICYLNDPISYSLSYNIDVSTSQITFPKSARINRKDCLSLWMIISPGELDLNKLLNTRDVDLLFLIRRASIQRNFEILESIIIRTRKIKKNLTKKKLTTIRFLFFKRLSPKPRRGINYTFSILKNLRKNDNLLTVTEFIEVEILKTSKLKFSTTFQYKNQSYELMKLKDIIQCLNKNFMNIRVLGSIGAYLKYGNLPLPNEFVCNSDHVNQADLTVFMKNL